MNRNELINAFTHADLAFEGAETLDEQLFLADASWAYKVAYLMLTDKAHLLPTEQPDWLAS